MASVRASSSAIDAVARSQKSRNGLGATKASFLGGMKLRQKRWRARTTRRALSVSAEATERPLWFPGSTPPPWLDGRYPSSMA